MLHAEFATNKTFFDSDDTYAFPFVMVNHFESETLFQNSNLSNHTYICKHLQ